MKQKNESFLYSDQEIHNFCVQLFVGSANMCLPSKKTVNGNKKNKNILEIGFFTT